MQTKQFVQFLKSAMPIAALTWVTVAATACRPAGAPAEAPALASRSVAAKTEALSSCMWAKEGKPNTRFITASYKTTLVVELGNTSYYVEARSRNINIPPENDFAGLRTIGDEGITLDLDWDGSVDAGISVDEGLYLRNSYEKPGLAEKLQSIHQQRIDEASEYIGCKR